MAKGQRASIHPFPSVAAGLLMLAVGSACASNPKNPAAHGDNSPPAWLQTLPREKNAIYAIGSAGPTFFPQDSLRYAKEDAWAQLAHTVATQVTSITVTVSSESGSNWTDTASVVEATSGLAEAVVEFGEIIATWVDRRGIFSGSPGSSYALVRLELGRVASVHAASRAEDAADRSASRPSQAEERGAVREEAAEGGF